MSSGDAVAIAFKGRPNTVFLGEASGGYTTVTHWDAVTDGLTASVSVAHMGDRQGRVYESNLSVEHRIDFVPGVTIETNAAIAEAADRVRHLP